MKIKNKFLSIFVSCTILFTMSLSQMSYASTNTNKISNSEVSLLSSQVPNDVYNYASNDFPKELNLLKRNPQKYNFNIDELSNFKLGQAFDIYFYKNNVVKSSNYYCYPVVYNNSIKAIYTITKISNGKYTTTLSKSFSQKLDSLKNYSNSAFRIVNANNDLFAISSNSSLLINKDPNNKLKSNSITTKDINTINKEMGNNKNEHSIKANIASSSSTMTANDVVLDAENGLNVPIVLQNGYNWCWAATCASIIDYLKNQSLQAVDVVKYVYNGSTPNVGGSNATICDVYSHWGLNPNFVERTLSYTEVCNNIDGNVPINMLLYYDDPKLGWEGHSMSLIGYAHFSDDTIYYEAIDPNYDDYTIISGTDSGTDCEYSLNGDPFTWQVTIIP